MTTHTFPITVNDQKMNVSYTPNCFANYGHFEFRSPYQPRQRILISETGYRSHFAPMWHIEEFGYLHEYAIEIVNALLKGSKANEETEEESQQIALF